MKAKSRRQHDSIVIPEGFFFEPYEPAATPIVSPSTGDTLQYVKMCLSEDANVTFRDSRGNLVTAFPLAKGERSFLVSQIITVSAGTVAIIHDGVRKESDEDFTGPVYDPRIKG